MTAITDIPNSRPLRLSTSRPGTLRIYNWPWRALSLRRLPALAMLLMLVGGFAVSASFVISGALQKAEVPLTFKSFTEGHSASVLAKAYDAAMPARDFAIALNTAWRTALFGEGSKGVVIGRNGTLFTAEELDAPLDEAARASNAISFIVETKSRLQLAGSELVVVVVPAKTAIYGEMLGRTRQPELAAHRYQILHDALAAAGVAATDLKPLFIDHKSIEPVFLRTDTHWTPAGAGIAALAVANLIETRIPLPKLAFTEQRAPVVQHTGDLMKFVPLQPWFSALQPAPDEIAGISAVKAATDANASGDGALFDDTAAPVGLVGTSYSANDLWGFEAALKLALQADVVNYSKTGHGPYMPMRCFLARAAADPAILPKLVIWEIPERYLSLEADARVADRAIPDNCEG